MPWVTDAELKDAVANALRSVGASLPAHWTGIIARANVRAYHRIRRVLVGKGWPLAALDTWAEREAFNLECGICLTFRAAKLPDGVDAGALRDFCECWKELEEIGVILDDGGQVIPQEAAAGGVGSGDYDTSGDTFTPDTVL